MSKPKHHVLFTGKTWSSQPATKELRGNPWLIIPIEAEAHKEIHRQIATVPVLDHFTAQRTLREFYPARGDYLKTIVELAFSIEEAINNPKARCIEKGIGELVIHSLEIQYPLIEKGLLELR